MNDKELVAKAAVEYVTQSNNITVGLGTGSTANYFIDELSQKIKEKSLDIKVVASSTISNIKAVEAGLLCISFDQIETIDYYVDGADEITVDASIAVLKGRGYDLIREKLLASASHECIIIGDKSKIVNKIGANFPIPVEVSPIAWKITKRIIEEFSVKCDLRKNSAGDGYSISSCGNLILDCNFEYGDISLLSKKLSEVPGVLEHGIFLNIVNTAIVANNGEIKKYEI